MKTIKLIIKAEEAAQTIAGILLLFYYNLGLSFWIWFLLFFSPDISMFGYLFNTRVGAFCYNLFHHKGIALVIVGIGIYFQLTIFISIGILLFAHSSFDRLLGYGLKYSDSFRHTSLGWLPQKNTDQVKN